MSEDGSEDVRDAFASKAEAEGLKCRLCAEEIAYEDKEAFFSTGLCSRCHHGTRRDS
jgi:hypothetical protein